MMGAMVPLFTVTVTVIHDTPTDAATYTQTLTIAAADLIAALTVGRTFAAAQLAAIAAATRSWVGLSVDVTAEPRGR